MFSRRKSDMNKKRIHVDWINHKIVVLPVSGINESIRRKGCGLLFGMKKNDPVDNVIWFIFPTEDNEDYQTIRVYIGYKAASKMRIESLELNISIQDNMQRRCFVVLIECYINSNDEFYAKECAKYAGVLETEQMNDTFRFLDDHYSNDNRPGKKELLHILINYIQRNRHSY